MQVRPSQISNLANAPQQLYVANQGDRPVVLEMTVCDAYRGNAFVPLWLDIRPMRSVVQPGTRLNITLRAALPDAQRSQAPQLQVLLHITAAPDVAPLASTLVAKVPVAFTGR